MHRIWFFAVALICGIAAAHAQGAGGVTGTVTLDGKVVALTNVYATEFREIPDLAEAGQEVTLLLLLADRPLPPKATGEIKFLQSVARGQIHGLVLTLNINGTQVVGATAATDGRVKTLSGQQHADSMRVESFRRTGGRIEAHLTGGRVNNDNPIFSFPVFDLRVATSVQPAPAWPAPLVGGAARKSPPAVALAAVLEAIARKNTAGIRAGIPNGASLTADEINAIGEQYQLSITVAELMAKLIKAYVGDTNAKLFFKDDTNSIAFTMIRTANGWKLDL